MSRDSPMNAPPQNGGAAAKKRIRCGELPAAFCLIPDTAGDIFALKERETAMKRYQYPFSAMVDQEGLKTALLLNAVDPSIGGLLIRGHKGTGKSTAARALAQLLPLLEVWEDSPFNSDPKGPVSDADADYMGGPEKPRRAVSRPMPFVELPLNATEDRLVGSLHIERALQAGERRFEPGLLARANRGILYVDEVNLLADHLVDMLLDAAASGVNTVEREGISFVHPARFILIGTMNPEEGELRPQFLDRFGLSVTVESVLDLASRKAIVQRRLAFERDPEGFWDAWASADRIVSDQIAYARGHLNQVSIPGELMTAVVGMTRELQLQGHRADVTILKAARAHAALMEKSRIDAPDISESAQLAIRHRMKSFSLEAPETLRGKIADACESAFGSGAKSDPGRRREISLEEMAESMQVPGSMAAGSVLFSFLGKKHAETVHEPDREYGGTAETIEKLLSGGEHGKRKARTAAVSGGGRYLRAERIRAGDRDFSLAVDATLRQAALRSGFAGGGSEGRFGVKEEDLRKKRRAKPCENLVVFVVDSSGSMGSGPLVRMKAAKGAALAMLRNAKQERSEVALVAFGGQSASVLLPPTSSVAVAESALESLPSGGGTPFSDGLFRAWQLIRSERLKNAGVRPVLVIISDGEANVPISPGADPLEEVSLLAEKIAADRIDAVFIDAAGGKKGRSGMQHLAGRMHAAYVALSDLSAPSILKAVLDRGEPE